MTTQEITEAKNLIASMRDDLSRIAGGGDDADKAATEVLEKLPDMFACQEVALRLLGRTETLVDLTNALVVLRTVAQLLVEPRRDADRDEIMAKHAPFIESNFAKVEQLINQPLESTAQPE